MGLPRSRPSRFQQGFTLLEILVVVLIIGILVTFASLSISNRALEDRLEFEARRLDRTLRLALEEAEIKGLLIGFRYLPDRYEFVTLGDKGQWQVLDAGPLRKHALAPPFEIELRVEGQIVPPAQEPEKSDDKDDERDQDKSQDKSGEKRDPKSEPQILLLPSGEVTAFVLALRVGDLQSRYLVESDALGKFAFTYEPLAAKK